MPLVPHEPVERGDLRMACKINRVVEAQDWSGKGDRPEQTTYSHIWESSEDQSQRTCKTSDGPNAAVSAPKA